MEAIPYLAIIGGSGLYEMPDLQFPQEYEITTPFGKPSAPIVVGTLDGKRIAFLARHGIGHHISPTEVNYRANIYALKSLGVKNILSISACGSLREDYAPGHIVIPDQLFDRTRDRPRSFFGSGLVAHVGVADPFCKRLSKHLLTAMEKIGVTTHDGGSLITIEGPRFSTRGESNVYRAWGMSIIGMTTSPEAFLAREAEMCYAVMAHVTDYDVWHISEDPVTVDMVVRILKHNTETAQEAIRNLVSELSKNETCTCQSALEGALITQPEMIPPETIEHLGLLIDKYIKPMA
jgi:5'-methylthioadenosine phosphorylase